MDVGFVHHFTPTGGSTMKRVLVVIAATMAVVSSAWALEPSGTYTYKEKGYSGDMTISRVNDYEASWKIKILTVQSSSANMCEVEGVIDNLINDDKTIEAMFMSTDDSPGKFTVKFTKAGAVVDVTESVGFCGMNAYFGGKWTKDGKKHKAKKRP
jgi:hypothetical protein